jgi:putative Holliday junction resolvase
LDLPAFAAALPARGALLGLDPGAKRIGVAASDPDRAVGTSIATIDRKKIVNDVKRILELYDARACIAVVIGLPLNMDGTSGAAAQAARAFARNFSLVRDAPVLMWDERLSTAAVTRAMIETDASRKRRGQMVDKLAAGYMLQGALDALKARARS